MNLKLAIENIRNELKSYIIKNNNIQSLVIGISGGIDSALCAALAKPVCDELGIHLHGRSITIGNKNKEINRAQLVGKHFCHTFVEIWRLKEVFSNMWYHVKSEGRVDWVKDEKKKLRQGNIKARLRMIYLYDLAQLYNGMVLSTDNYTEYLLGFWTLHGDVGDYGMIQNLWKTEVYELADWICNNELSIKRGKDPLHGIMYEALKKCIEAQATDGLGITNTDLDQILPGWKGTSKNGYKEVDKILKNFIEKNIGNLDDSNNMKNKVRGLKKLLYVGAIAVAGLSLFGKNVEAQIPTEAYEYVANPLVQPNDTNWNWYGSGAVNKNHALMKNGTINWEDANRLDSLINGTFSDPADLRLYDRADVNGDNIVNLEDKIILEDYLSDSRPYLPGQFNKLKTRTEKEDWLQKMIEIAQPNQTCLGLPADSCDCTQYSDQMLIDFNGLDSEHLAEFLKEYSYDTINNGRFNLPVLSIYLSDGSSGFHAMNTIVLGNNITKWEDLCNIEPQRNLINVQPGQAYLNGWDSNFIIKGPPMGYNLLKHYVSYNIKDNVPTLDYVMPPSPPFILITKKDTLNPNNNIIGPVNGVDYKNSPDLIYNVIDETIFDMFKEVNGEKEYYNPYIWYSLDSGKTKTPLFKQGNFNLNLQNGNYNLILHAEDDFKNESSDTINFSVNNNTGLEDKVLDNKFLSYPNPAKDIIRFEFENMFGKEVSIEMYNTAGQLIGKEKTNKEKMDYDISNYSYGLYLYRALDDSGKTISSGKIVKK